MSTFVYICVALNASLLVGALSTLIAILSYRLGKVDPGVGAIMLIAIPCLISGCLIAGYIV